MKMKPRPAGGGNLMNLCVECKTNTAHYWNSHLCEDCFKKILSGDLEFKVKQAKAVEVSTPS